MPFTLYSTIEPSVAMALDRAGMWDKASDCLLKKYKLGKRIGEHCLVRLSHHPVEATGGSNAVAYFPPR